MKILENLMITILALGEDIIDTLFIIPIQLRFIRCVLSTYLPKSN